MAINKRKRIIDEVDQTLDEEDDEDNEDEDEGNEGKNDASQKYHNPSDQARRRITDDGKQLIIFGRVGDMFAI